MGLMGPGAPNANHTMRALKGRQSKAKIEDANQSTRPRERTLAEIQKEYKR